MSNEIERVSVAIYDQETGLMTGYVNPLTLKKEALVSGAGIADATDVTLASTDAGSNREPSTTLTYTANTSTAWAVRDGMSVWLPTSGTISFAVSGGATLNGATSTLTRTLANNPIGYVVFNRIQGTHAYSVSGA